MDYHVFKKPKIKNGKKIYKWYYYYTKNGRQIQKACKNCSNRSDAESYIRTLPSWTAVVPRSSNNGVTEPHYCGQNYTRMYSFDERSAS